VSIATVKEFNEIELTMTSFKSWSNVGTGAHRELSERADALPGSIRGN